MDPLWYWSGNGGGGARSPLSGTVFGRARSALSSAPEEAPPREERGRHSPLIGTGALRQGGRGGRALLASAAALLRGGRDVRSPFALVASAALCLGGAVVDPPPFHAASGRAPPTLHLCSAGGAVHPSSPGPAAARLPKGGDHGRSRGLRLSRGCEGKCGRGLSWKRL